MIDKNLHSDTDRELHARFFEVYKEHRSQVNLWPPMDVYELFYRLGREDTLFIPGEQPPSAKSEAGNLQSEIPPSP